MRRPCGRRKARGECKAWLAQRKLVLPESKSIYTDNLTSYVYINSMRKSFQYRLYPTKQQRRVLANHLEACRRLYNTLLCDRVQAYENRGESLSLYDQHRDTLSQDGLAPLGVCA